MAEGYVDGLAPEAPARLREYLGLMKDLVDEGKRANEALRGATSSSGMNTGLQRSLEVQEKLISSSKTWAQQRRQDVQIYQAEAREIKELQKYVDQLEKARQKEIKTQERLNNAYERLKKQYNDTANESKRLGVELGTENKQYLAVTAQANKYYQQLITLEKAVGQNQRRVGAYNDATLELTQIFRELPAFTYSVQTGLLGISNNIGPLTDKIQQLIKETGSVGGAIRSLAGSLLTFNVISSVAVGLLTIFGDRIFSSSKAVSAADESLKRYNDTLKSIDDNSRKTSGEEIARLRLLEKTATDTSISMEKRKRAVDELQRLYPSYLGNISQEAILTGQAAGVTQDLTRALLANAAAKATADKYAAAYLRELELVNELTIAQQKQQVAITAVNRARADAGRISRVSGGLNDRNERQTGGLALAEATLESTRRNIEDIRKGIAESRKETERWGNAALEAANKVPDLLGADTKKVSGGKTAAEKIEDTTDALAKMRMEIIELGRALNNPNNPDEIGEGQQGILGLQLSRISESSADQILRLERQLYEDSTQVTEQYRSGAIKSKEEYEKKLLKLQTEYALRRLKVERDEIAASIPLLSGADRSQAQTRLSGIEFQISQLTTTQEKAGFAERIENVRDFFQQYKDVLSEFGNFAAQIGKNITEQELGEIATRRANLEEETKRKIELATLSGSNEVQQARLVAQIEADAQAQRNKLREDEIRVKQRAAIFDKANALFQIALNTAIGATAAAAKGNVVGVGAIITLGALQAGTVLAAPLPQYAKGVESKPTDGLAIVGEKGVELVETPDGRTFLTPNQATVMDLPKGTRVTSHQDLLRQTAGLSPELLKMFAGKTISTKEMERAQWETVNNTRKTNAYLKQLASNKRNSSNIPIPSNW